MNRESSLAKFKRSSLWKLLTERVGKLNTGISGRQAVYKSDPGTNDSVCLQNRLHEQATKYNTSNV